VSKRNSKYQRWKIKRTSHKYPRKRKIQNKHYVHYAIKVKHHLCLKGLCKTRWSVRVKATEALLSILQSVVECLEEESENSETNSESLFRARCSIKSLNWVFFLNLIWWNKILQIIDVVSR